MNLRNAYRTQISKFDPDTVPAEIRQMLSGGDMIPFFKHLISDYFFEHIEENAKLELQDGFGVSESDIGYYERTGTFPFLKK